MYKDWANLNSIIIVQELLEGDNLNVMNAIKRLEANLLLGGVIVTDITRVALTCNMMCVSFVKREVIRLLMLLLSLLSLSPSMKFG